MLQWGHAFSDVETRSQNRFPVEREELQWGHAFSDVETDRRPRRRTGRLQLQWGHAFSDVETQEYEGISLSVLTASMGPRLFRRGNADHACVIGGGIAGASMGPRLFRRGNSIWMTILTFLQSSFNGATPFQTWKQHTPRPRPQTAARLQWGHAFSDVETCGDRHGDCRASRASMGPRLFRRGNA